MTTQKLEALAEKLWHNRRQEGHIWEPMATELITLSQQFEDQSADQSEDHPENETEESIKIEVKGYCHLAHALLNQAKGEFEKAHVAVDLALEAFDLSGQLRWQARGLMISGFLQVNMNLFQQALEDWKRAYDMGQIIEDREIIINSLYSIAILNRVSLQRYQDAIGYFNRVLKLCMETDPPNVLTGNVYSGLSKCHMALEHRGLALRYAQQALAYAKEFGDKRTLGWSLELCVSTHITLGDIDKAYGFAKENLETWILLDDAYGIAIAYQDLATVHRLMGELEQALDFNEKALAFAKGMQSQLVLETLYLEMANVAEAIGNYGLSLSYYKAYMEIREKSLKASFNQEISKVAGELKLENYRLKHVELEEKMRALKVAQEALVRSEKMNALLGLIGGVAHKINTPLGNSILLNSFILDQCENLLKKSSTQDLLQRDFVNYLDSAIEAQKGIEKGLSTVAHIVESFKRIAVNPSMIKREPVNTREFLEGWKKGLALYYPSYKPDIQIICDTQHYVSIDPLETIKVLDELFLNAMDHGYKSPFEGPFTVQILVAPQNNLAFEFKDFGSGIEPEVLKKIFEPFVKLGSSTSHLGIGLHVVYNVVVYVLEGSITIESELGKGTHVKINLL